MNIKVIGAGLGRTGTMSLKGALEQLGFGPCYHMIEVIENPKYIDVWYDAAHGKPLDYSVFDGFQSVVDWPAVAYWRELIDHYPDAKVILTTRSGESWYKSVTETIFGRMTMPLPADTPQERRRHRAMTQKTVLENTFRGRFLDKDYAIGVYEKHNADVRATVAPSRLLDYQLKDGWEPLCRFLGVPVPAEPMPHLNDTASFLAWVAEDDPSEPVAPHPSRP